MRIPRSLAALTRLAARFSQPRCAVAGAEIKPRPSVQRRNRLGSVARAAAGAVLALGLAAGRPAAAEEPLTLVAFGDSLVAGFGLPVEEGFAPQLEAWLRAQGAAVTVVNAGVSGDTTSGGRARLDWSIGPEADAVILELGANDALRGVPVAETRANLEAMIARLRERGLPVLIAGMRAPGNWGEEYAAEFNAMYPTLADSYEAPLYPFFLEAIMEDLPGYLQPDGLHPNARGVAAIVEDIGPATLELLAQAREGA